MGHRSAYVSRLPILSFPAELTEAARWVCWQGTPDPARPGKLKKMPINPRTGGNAQSNNPASWSDYRTACAAAHNFSGIGYMLGDGIFGVDIDNAASEIEDYIHDIRDGVIAEFIDSLKSYTETSQSGNGIHIICRGELPPGGRRKGNVEMYSEGRFFIMTGKQFGQYDQITDCTEAIKPLHEKYIGSRSNSKITRPAATSLSSSEIVTKAMASKNGQAFSLLWAGQWEGLYTSQSEADLALCNMLAFWCGRDITQMDELFRASGLMRDKWDRHKTYRDNTLKKAADNCQNVYQQDDGYRIIIKDWEEQQPQECDQPPKCYSYDDMGNAERYQDMFGEITKYNQTNKGWMYYNGKCWLPDVGGATAEALADTMVQDMRREFTQCETQEEEEAFRKHLKYCRSNKGKKALLQEVRHRISVYPENFDKNINLINTQSGVLDLTNGNLADHSHEQFLSKITSVEYSDHVDCPRWMQFLNEIFAGDEGLIGYIQMAVGYSLTGSTKEQCLFFCVGNGRNGKSTFLEVIAEIMGSYAANIQPDTIMIKQQSNSANSDIARLKGVRLVTTAEPNEGCRLDEGLIKQLTGGDRITARYLYGENFEFVPQFKLWMATNYKPIIRGRDDGIWRRMHIIPFDVQIPEGKVDKDLPAKLRQEYVGILNWAVEGCALWQQSGLKMPGCVKDAVKEYQTEMDIVTRFLNENTVTGPGKEIKASDLYNAYRNWARENKEFEMSNTRFGREMKGKFNKIKKSAGLFYVGVSLSSYVYIGDKTKICY